MDTQAKRLLGYDTIHYEDVAGKGAKQISFSQVDVDTACRYAAEDADVTLRLHRAQWPQLEGDAQLRSVYETIEMPLVPVLARMEQRGVLIDAAALKRQSHELARRMHELTERAHALAGHAFSLDSTKQLGAILFEELKLPALVKTPGGQPSTNEEALEAIADQHELPRVILDYRSLAKLRSTYTEKLAEIVNPRTGRVHTSYGQATAATGRLSSSDPNLQNIPIRTEEGRRIRQAFVAPEGWRIVAADYSQIELRIMAHLSGDAGLLAAFHGNQDIHRATAAEVFGLPQGEVDANQRRAAKAINFGLMYGMSAFGLARQLGVAARRGAGLHGALFLALSGRADLHGRNAREGAPRRLRGNPVRPPSVPGLHQLAQPGAARRRGTRGDQRADAGHRGRHHQARNDRGRRLAARAGRRCAHADAGARRTGVRGARGPHRCGRRRRARTHGRGGGTGGAAGGRRWGRRELGRGALRPMREAA